MDIAQMILAAATFVLANAHWLLLWAGVGDIIIWACIGLSVWLLNRRKKIRAKAEAE